MIRLKTAVLIAASLACGAMIAGAGKNMQHAFYEFGIAAGMAFQLQDDYLDTFGDVNTFGKKCGGDIIANKKTYLYLRAIERADNALGQRLKYLYTTEPEDPIEKITEVKESFEKLEVASATASIMLEYHKTALTRLAEIRAEYGDVEALEEFARKVMIRNH